MTYQFLLLMLRNGMSSRLNIRRRVVPAPPDRLPVACQLRDACVGCGSHQLGEYRDIGMRNTSAKCHEPLIGKTPSSIRRAPSMILRAEVMSTLKHGCNLSF